MKTLLFTIEYPPFHGGVANYYYNLFNHWPANEKIAVLDNANNQLLCGRLWPKWLPALFFLRQKIKQEKFDQIIVGQLLPLGIVAFLLSLFCRISFSVIIHGMELSFAQKKSRKKLISRLILGRAKNIICAGSHTAELAKRFLGEKYSEKIHIVNPGVCASPAVDQDLLEKIKTENDLSGKTVLFTVARLVKRKGHDMAIAAMKELAPGDASVHYYIAGTGPDEVYLKEIAQGMNNVHFLGKISNEEKWAWLALSDIFIMPSRDIGGDFEGFGIVYLEAAMAGRPVIAGDSGGVRDAVIDNETGLLIDPENPTVIAEAILKLTNDPFLRKQMGEAGKARAKKDFDWNRQAEKACDLLLN